MSGAPVVLFRVAAGPRIGHGHLRRAEALARTLGGPSVLSMRGAGAPTSLTLLPPGGTGATLEIVRPAVLVLDDPHARHAQAWASAATRRRIPVVSLHDLGIARVESTLAIDGSVTSPAHGWPAARTLRGLAYAVIRPPRRARRGVEVDRMLVSLGGGAREALTRAVLAELVRRHPGVDLLVPQACHDPQAVTGPARVRRVAAPDGLAPWFARVDVAIVGGGVSLYEAVAAGLPTVAVPVVPAQVPTIRAFAARRLTFDAGGRRGSVTTVARRVADLVDAMVADRAWRRRVQREGPRLVDGRGARRVARAIHAVAEAARHG
jgi:spore coat polysaccharide biosynthesis predicted glycosyltransferase SpsG